MLLKCNNIVLQTTRNETRKPQPQERLINKIIYVLYFF